MCTFFCKEKDLYVCVCVLLNGIFAVSCNLVRKCIKPRKHEIKLKMLSNLIPLYTNAHLQQQCVILLQTHTDTFTLTCIQKIQIKSNILSSSVWTTVNVKYSCPFDEVCVLMKIDKRKAVLPTLYQQ